MAKQQVFRSTLVQIVPIYVGAATIALNFTMLAVAVTTISTALQASVSLSTWLVTVYTLVGAGSLPFAGAIGDRFGHLRVFVGGLIGFAIFSALASMSTNLPTLLVLRACQAVAGAIVTPTASTLVASIGPPEQRATWFGLQSAFIVFGAGVGPLVGTLLLRGIGWRALFWGGVPLALLSAVGCIALVKGNRKVERGRPIDILGCVLFFLFIPAIAVGATRLGTLLGLGLVGLAIVLALSLVLRSFRVEAPVITARLFKIKAYAGAVLGNTTMTFMLHALLLLLPFYGSIWGRSPSTVAAAVLVQYIASIAGGPVGGRIADAYGRRIAAVGGTCLFAGALVALLLAKPSSLVGFCTVLGVLGLGSGISTSPRHASAIDSVPVGDRGIAASTFHLGRFLGGAFGAMFAGSMLAGAGSYAHAFGVLIGVAAVSTGASLALPSVRTRS